MEIRESGENYLETILELEQTKGIVRSVDIASSLGFSKPSVSRAMSVLKKAGYIEREAYGNIVLTEFGRIRANEIYDRHVLLTCFFTKYLLLSPDIAEQDACRIEHVISPETMDCIRAIIKNI